MKKNGIHLSHRLVALGLFLSLASLMFVHGCKSAGRSGSNFKDSPSGGSDSPSYSEQYKEREMAVIKRIKEILPNDGLVGKCTISIAERSEGELHPKLKVEKNGTNFEMEIDDELKEDSHPWYGKYLELQDSFGGAWNPAMGRSFMNTADFYLDKDGKLTSVVTKEWEKLGAWIPKKRINCP